MHGAELVTALRRTLFVARSGSFGDLRSRGATTLRFISFDFGLSIWCLLSFARRRRR